jgi:crossover junction endodeoxyribonuclease RuvC
MTNYHGSLWVGIDPGLAGAVAVIDRDGRLLEVADMPALSDGGKRRVDPAGLVAVLMGAVGQIRMATVERVHSMPKQGVASAFSFGASYGVVLGVLAALRVPYQLVTPQRWKREMMDGQGKEKAASRMVARRLWPDHADLFARVKDDGRAEAALIAEWGRRSHHHAGAGASETQPPPASSDPGRSTTGAPG